MDLSDLTALEKSQQVRLADILLLGPFMVLLSLNRRPGPVARTLLRMAGIMTITYNARNYLKIAEAQKKIPRNT